MCPIFWNSANSGAGIIASDTTGYAQDPDLATTPSTPKLLRIPGSSVGAVPTAYQTSARAVYPVYDGVTEVSGVLQSLAIDPQTLAIDYSRYPTTFWSDLDLDALPASVDDLTLATAPVDFTNWHSAFQAEFIVRTGEANGDDPPEYVVTAGTETIAIYMLDDDNRPVNLMALTLSDYNKLSNAEKLRFDTNLSTSGHMASLGLTSVEDDKTALQTTLTGYLTLIGTSGMSTLQEALFSKQIQMLKDDITAAVAVSTEKITEAAEDIMARFKIVDQFVRAVRPTAITVTGLISMERTDGYGLDFSQMASSSTLVKTQVNCLDGGTRMDEGITKFIRAETEILNMKERRQVIAQNAAYRDPNLDVPNLIYQLQLLYEGENKAIVDAGTEEFRQLHKLLEDYNVMQQLLSTTISYFDTGDTDEKRRFMNIGQEDDGDIDEKTMIDYELAGDRQGSGLNYNNYDETYSNGAAGIDVLSSPIYHWSVLANYTDSLSTMHRDFLTALESYDFNLSVKPDSHTIEGDYDGKLSEQQMLAFAMFVDEPWATLTSRTHPIEDLYGAERPSFDLVDQTEEGAGSLKLLSKNAFDQFQTQLSNTITILNQQNQIKQNDVENATKQQNRHFELGNNALRKMNDLLLMIGRS